MKKILSVVFAAFMIAAVFAAAVPASAAPLFEDVEPDRWSAGAIRYVYDREYMIGTGDGAFSPDGTLTRATVVTVLWRREACPRVPPESGFSDVESDAWYAHAVAWARNKGIVFGISDDLFDPERPVTREALAAMLERYSVLCPVSVPERDDLSSFSDADRVSAWATDALGWAVAAGVLEGTGDSTLDPSGSATREQFAALLERFDGAFTLKYNEPVPISRYTEPEYPLVTDADIYVSTTGSDDNDGSFDHPLATFAGAIATVRGIDKTGKDGVTVAFMAGTYEIREGIVFTEEDGGTAECPITYCAYGDGDVVISGGSVIPSEDFTVLDEEEKEMFPSLYVDRVRKVDLSAYGVDPTALTESNTVCKARERLDAARWPNKYDSGNDAFVDLIASIAEDERSMTLHKTINRRVAKYHNLDDLYMFGYYKYDWTSSYGPVLYYEPETGFITPTVNGYGIHKFQETYAPCPYFYFYNIPDELDRTDEYYIDKKTGYLYVIDPEDYYVISLCGTMLTINADHLAFKGLELCYGTNDCIYASSNDLELNGCDIHNVYHYGAEIHGDRVTVYGCDFYETGYRSVDLRSGDRVTLTPGDSVIENCLFDHFASIGKTMNPAVYVGGCGIRVAHNEMCYSSNSAIVYSEYIWASNYITIEYNYIHDVVTQSSDYGAIYAGRNLVGHGSVVRYNLITNVGNRIEQHSSLGIYLDDSQSGQEIYGNVFFNTANMCVFTNGGRENSIHDNIIIEPDQLTNAEIVLGQATYDSAEESTEGFTKPINYEEHNNFLILDLVPFRNELWSSRFPLPAKYVYDLDNMAPYADDPDCPLNPSYNEVYGNLIVTGQKRIDAGGLDFFAERVIRFGTRIEESATCPLTENPFFVNPTAGDYRLRDGADFEPIPYELIGRY